MKRLTLDFISSSPPELNSTLFHCPLSSRDIRCLRGRVVVAGPGMGTFSWTSGAKALAVVVLKAKLDRMDSGGGADLISEIGIHGEAGTLAAALDSALSKEPNWLRDMFGLDSKGELVARRVFLRRNPEGRRPGPRSVALNTAFMSPDTILVTMDGTELSDSAIRKLVQNIESSSDIAIPAQPKQTESRTLSLDDQKLLPFAIECIRVPMRNENLGIEQATLVLDDVIVQVLATLKSLTVEALRNQIICLLRSLVSEQSLLKALERLTVKGIVRKRDDLVQLNNYWLGSRLKLLENIMRLVTRLEEDPEPQVRLGHDQAALALSIRFQSVASYDRFMPMLLEDVLEEFAFQKDMLWQINHPWWPFVRPHRENGQAKYSDKFGRVVYVSPSTLPLDRWIQKFYKGLGVESVLGKGTGLSGDLWVCEDLVICQYLSPDLESEIDNYFRVAKDPEAFDAPKFVKLLSGAYVPAIVRIMVSPGLAGLISASIAQPASPKPLVSVARRKFV